MAGRRRCSEWLLPLACTATLLAGCGGGGSGGGSSGGAVITGNFFPLDSDGRWFYASAGGSSTVRVIGPGTVGTVSGTLVETVDDATGAVIDQTVYAVAADGVRQYPLGQSDPILAALSGFQLLRYPLVTGDAYVQLETSVDVGDLDFDGRSERVALRSENTVVGLETVSTAAGVFAGALRQRQVVRASIDPTGGGATVTVTTTIDTWYGRDVGPVQATVRVVGPGVDETVIEGLTAYGVGGRRSESVAPTVLATTPALVAVRSVNAMVSAEFSEALDPASVNSTTFGVRRAAGGQPVPGSVGMQGNTVRFTPDTLPWPSGSYIVTVDGVRDRVGNALAAPRTWTFDVDETLPGVLASTPGMNAVDVSLGSNIVVDFTEALDPAGIVAANVILFDDLGNVHPTGLALATTRLTVSPSVPLAAGRSYQLRLNRLADRLGNPLPDFVLFFSTVQGLFSRPVELIANTWALANAVGDVNGDGIPDVLMSTLASAPPPYDLGLFVRLGLLGGNLSAPQRLDAGPQFTGCPAMAIVIGDLDGDGRNDVAIGTFGCGIQVLRQTSTGTLAPAEYLSTTLSGRLRLADLDGDGKLDLLGVGGDAQVGIWKRGAGGAMVESGTFSTGALGAIDVDVGDLDGDGRPDIAVALAPGQIGQDLAVFHQQPDGTFGAGSVLATGSTFGSARVAVGDLTGDGRADLFATAVDRVVGFHQGPGGAFEPRQTYATKVSANYLSIADLDGDGKDDLVVGHMTESSLGVYRQQSGNLGAEELFIAPALVVGALQPFALADLNGDGRRDIVVNGSLLRQLPNGGSMAQRVVARRSALAAPATAAGGRSGGAIRGAMGAAVQGAGRVR